MVDLSTDLLSAAEADVLGLAILGADRTIRRKVGRLVEWLPAIGEDSCQSALLVGMEPELEALAEGRRDVIALSGVRGASPNLDHPVTAVVLWSKDRSHYVVIAMRDYTARQIEVLFENERRARRLIEQQLEAASSEARFASLARTRLRLARDLHDTLVHSLLALLTQIRLTRHFLAKDPARVSDGLATAEEAAISGLGRVRDAIARLRMPDDVEAAPDFEVILFDFAEQTGIKLSVEIDDGAREGLRTYKVAIHRILSEALRNVEIHSEASQLRVRAVEPSRETRNRLVVEIRDDGTGFNTAIAKPEHFGLVGMTEVAEGVGGECVVQSSPGSGTLVRISLPTPSTLTRRSDGLAHPGRMARGTQKDG